MSLSRISRRLSPIAVTALLGGYLGCAAHPSKSIYRLTNLDSQYFLLSPDAASTQGDRQTLRIPRPHESGNAKDAPAMDCSIKSRWFSFYGAPGNPSYWVAETPSTSASRQSAGAIDMKDQWQSFERALDGFDLAPGMQLQIDHDFFGPHAPDQPPSTNYQGTTITYYEVFGNIESGARLRFVRTEKRSAGSTTPDAKASESVGFSRKSRLLPVIRNSGPMRGSVRDEPIFAVTSGNLA
jgi:hypothetical protein